MAQTISDEAQRTTIAFSGLALMTGNIEAQSFFPPGKVADYTGFQYLRDNDPSDMGHNTSFLTRVANNVLDVLDDAQMAQLKALASQELSLVESYGYKRFTLMQAFRRTVENDLPPGSRGLNVNAVKQVSRDLYLIDGAISFERAVLYSTIVRSLTPTQKARLDGMKGKGWASWPDVTDDQVRAKTQGLAAGTAVLVMTYASDIYSWSEGSLEADVYFCPERHGTYYGGFYIKDAPAVGHEGYGIDEQLTATAGSALVDARSGYVTATQASAMSALVDRQRSSLYAGGSSSIVGVRTDIATLLRSLLSPLQTPQAALNTMQTRVLALSATYGELDGEMNHAYATTFASIYQSMSASQRTKLTTLRRQILTGRYADGTPYDYTTATTSYLYAEPVRDGRVLEPYTGNTDWLFFEPVK